MISLFSSSMSRREAMRLIVASLSSIAAPAIARNSRYTAAEYKQALIIDAQGGFDGGPSMARSAADATESGLTALSMTVGLVGNGTNRFDSVVQDIAEADGWIAQYPTTFMP